MAFQIGLAKYLHAAEKLEHFADRCPTQAPAGLHPLHPVPPRGARRKTKTKRSLRRVLIVQDATSQMPSEIPIRHLPTPVPGAKAMIPAPPRVTSRPPSPPRSPSKS
jgi:hypothetical protein